MITRPGHVTYRTSWQHEASSGRPHLGELHSDPETAISEGIQLKKELSDKLYFVHVVKTTTEYIDIP